MNITDYLRRENIFLDVRLPDKPAVLDFIARAAVENGIVNDAAALHRGLLQREQTMSTGVGGGLGFPHTTTAEAEKAAVLLVRLAEPIDFDSLDNEPVNIVLALIIPESDRDIHVRLLARISRLCRNPAFLSAVKQSNEPDAVCQAMVEMEAASAVSPNSRTAS